MPSVGDPRDGEAPESIPMWSYVLIKPSPVPVTDWVVKVLE
jgi:hypothetical protein